MADPLPEALADTRGGVFFLWGDDEYRKIEAANALVAAHLDEATRDFNCDALRGRDVDVETLASMIATPPMMAEWRVLLVRDAEAFAGSSTLRDLILDTVDRTPPDLALILVAAIPDRSRAKFYTELKKKTRSVEFGAIGPDDVPGWLMEEAETRYGKPIAIEAARALGQALGIDLGVLSRELEKLVAVAGDEPEITVETVKAAGTHLPSQDRWKWFDLVGQREFDRAIASLPVLLSQGESGVGLTIGLASQLLRIAVVLEDGPAALEEALPPHQRWLAKQYTGQARKWTSDEVADALLGLRRVDRLLKSSPLPDQHHVEEWLLTRLSAARAA